MFSAETRILIVDDLPSAIELLAAQLRRLGFSDILEAPNGKEAYEILVISKSRGTPIDLIISDWNMPKLDGLDFLKLVRSNTELEQLPFLIVTTSNEKHKVVEAIQSGVTNYIVKPIDEATLKEKLERVWEKLNP